MQRLNNTSILLLSLTYYIYIILILYVCTNQWWGRKILWLTVKSDTLDPQFYRYWRRHLYHSLSKKRPSNPRWRDADSTLTSSPLPASSWPHSSPERSSSRPPPSWLEAAESQPPVSSAHSPQAQTPTHPHRHSFRRSCITPPLRY